MAMIANEEIDDKWTVGMVDDDKEIRHGWLRMGMAMIANEETDDKWIVGMVDYNKYGMIMKQRWQASVLTVSWEITHEEIENKRMIIVGNDNLKWMMIADEENDDSRIIVGIVNDNTREWEYITEKRFIDE